MSVRLHAERHDGDAAAPTLVFVHAFGASSQTWQLTVRALGGVLPAAAFDLRGWGASAAMPAGYSVGEMADDVAEAVAALGVARWALVGHSMGGKAAVALSARRPAGLTHLVLVAPSPPTPEPMADRDRQRLRGAWGSRAEAERIVRAVTAHPLAPAAFKAAVQDHLRASHAAWTAWLDAGSREDLSTLAARVGVPTLVVAGAEDAALGADVQRRETVARIPGARLETVDGAGHFIPLDAPKALAVLIRAHVLGG